jgi:transposase
VLPTDLRLEALYTSSRSPRWQSTRPAGCSTNERCRSATTSWFDWASALGSERLLALEDCRLLTPWLERQLLGRAEVLVRVSPRLTVPGVRASRTRGKSEPNDALAVARAALREPDLPRPQRGEPVYRELAYGISAS